MDKQPGQFEPGEKVPVSGQYRRIHTRFVGKRRRDGGEVTCVKGERFPPGSPKGGTVFELVDKTKHVETAHAPAASYVRDPDDESNRDD